MIKDTNNNVNVTKTALNNRSGVVIIIKKKNSGYTLKRESTCRKP